MPDLDPEERYDLARGLALLASVSAAAGPPQEPGGAASASDRAMGALRAAIAAGYRRDPAWFLADTDLASLRDRPDFRLLMMDLVMPADPFASAR
jgi:hypothetical protein